MSIEPPVTSPRTLAAAYAELTRAAATGGVTPIAGGTDLMVALSGEIGEAPARILDLWAVDGLRGIDIVGERLVLGALTTYAEIRASRACREHLPALVEAAATIGAAQIQGRGTLGGNAANASPAGDTLPLLLATDAVLVLGSARGEREVAAAHFWTGYRQTALARDELIVRIAFPLRAGREVRYRKVGTRRAQSISKVVMAVAWRNGSPSRVVARRPGRPRVGRGDPHPRAAHGGRPRGHATHARTGRPRRRDARRGARADRRRALDRGVPPRRRRASPAPHHPRRRRLVSAPLDRQMLERLFEGAPRFLDRLEAAGPMGDGRRRIQRGTDDRARDAGAGATGAHRCPPAARGAARDGVGAELRRAGVRPGSRHARRRPPRPPRPPRPRSMSRPSWSGSTTPTRPTSGSATACSWRVDRAPRSSQGSRPRSAPTGTPSDAGPSMRWSTSRRTAMPSLPRRPRHDGARTQSIRQGRDPAGSRRA